MSHPFNNNVIAIILSDALGRTDDALEYFTYALMKSFSELLNVVFNVSSVLSISGKKAYVQKAVDMVGVELDLLKASAVEDSVNYTYKMSAILLVLKACLHSRLGELEDMKSCVKEAMRQNDPISPSLGFIRFFVLMSSLQP